MTRKEAFAKSAEDNVWITHEYFTEEEHIRVNEFNIITHDGFWQSIERFNDDRQGKEWDEGWSIYEH